LEKVLYFFIRYCARVKPMEVLEVMKSRRSVRKYKSTPVPEESLKEVLTAARAAPSGVNAQPWKFVVVTDEEIKRKLVQACNGQKFIAEAPIVIVGCGFPDDAYATIGGYMNSHVIDVTIAMDHLILAAASSGLGTCWIGAFKEEKVKEILGIPPDVKVVALTPLGYPDEVPSKKSRKDLAELVCYDKFE
jgi:nitroreductase